jgi:hypothetical protein
MKGETAARDATLPEERFPSIPGSLREGASLQVVILSILSILPLAFILSLPQPLNAARRFASSV